jgi:short-subunit dehydrogenase
MRGSLAGKVVLITGPARGIGEATAVQLAARGARLSLVGLEPERLAAPAARLGEGHAWFTCDVTDQAALERAVAGTVQALGGINVVVANAGIGALGTVAVAPVEALVRVLEVNLIGVVRTVSATLPHLISSGGYYLLVSSASAFMPVPGIATYAASKIGVEHFGDSLRLELAGRGVEVGVAHPSWIDTDLVRDTQHDLETFNQMLRSLPGPLGTVTSVAACAEAFAGAIERRSRRVLVPRSLGAVAVARRFFSGRLADRILGGSVRRMIPRMEAEVRTLGRSFGEHSVEQTSSDRDGAG